MAILGPGDGQCKPIGIRISFFRIHLQNEILALGTSEAPFFHWVYGKNAPLRKQFAEKFYAEVTEFSLKISDHLPEEEPPKEELPDFWVFAAGETPPQWMIDGETPIIQFYWGDRPCDKTVENSSGLITPYIPKPMSFSGLVELFRDSLKLWAAPALNDIQGHDKCPRLAIIEDEESQQYLMREALSEIGFRSQTIFFESGAEALDELKKMTVEGRFPFLLFLDLLLPGMGGEEILKTLKSSELFETMPVAVLTGAQSSEELDFLRRMPRHFSFRLPLLDHDAIELIKRCFAFYKHARRIP